MLILGVCKKLVGREPCLKAQLVKCCLLGVVLLATGACQLALAQVTPPFVSPPATISTRELKAMLDQRVAAEKNAKIDGKPAAEADFVVVDVRSDSEIAVSMIPGAITKQQFEKDKDRLRSKLVIPYCLTGGRSATYANQLVQAGFTVKNFKGSMVDWVANELPLVTVKGDPTNRVAINPERFKVPAKYEAVSK